MNALCVLTFIGALALPCGSSGADGVPNPTVAGPITGGTHGQAFGAMTPAALAQSRYSETEYFYSGTASAFEKDGAWGMDGVWRVKPSTSAEYKVRLIVRRPVDARRFNGIVVVEWLNVTALQEGAADYSQMKEEIEREGYAWIGIGAQASGVNTPRSGLKAWDPERYGSLLHPGDAYSYDIFPRAPRPSCTPRPSIRSAAFGSATRLRPADHSPRSGSSPISTRSTRERICSAGTSCTAAAPTPQV